MPSSPSYSFSSSSSSSSKKIKTIIRNLVFFQLTHVSRVLKKAKSVLIEVVKEIHLNNTQVLVSFIFKKIKNRNNLYLDSFRFHYNYSSSYAVPPIAIHGGTINGYVHYEPMWSSLEVEVEEDSQLSGYFNWLEEKSNKDTHEINDVDYLAGSFEVEVEEDSQLSGYLNWLEEKSKGTHEINEIDYLADKFIANCHEKFMLEKQESDRRFQEMMARSM